MRKKYHVPISDFNRFMNDHSLHRGRKHFCRYSLHALISGKILKRLLNSTILKEK